MSSKKGVWGMARGRSTGGSGADVAWARAKINRKKPVSFCLSAVCCCAALPLRYTPGLPLALCLSLFCALSLSALLLSGAPRSRSQRCLLRKKGTHKLSTYRDKTITSSDADAAAAAAQAVASRQRQCAREWEEERGRESAACKQNSALKCQWTW